LEGPADTGLGITTPGFEPALGLFRLKGLAATLGRGLDPELGLTPGTGLDPELGLTPGTGLDPELGLTTEGFPSGLFGCALGCLGGRLTVD